MSFIVFDEPVAVSFVEARAEALKRLLAVVRDKLELETAFDLGCGVGYFSAVLRDMGFHVVAVDGRDENVKEAERRVPGVEFCTYDAENPELRKLGSFDLVLCFGLLYHLENPFRAIRNIHALTTKIAVVESMCAPGSQPSMRLLDEGRAVNQGLNYVAFYPTESCLVKMLYRAGFSFVYALANQPGHQEFQETLWRKRARTILVATNLPLGTPALRLLEEPQPVVDIWPTRLFRLRLRLAPLERMVRKLPPVRWALGFAGKRGMQSD